MSEIWPRTAQEIYEKLELLNKHFNNNQNDYQFQKKIKFYLETDHFGTFVYNWDYEIWVFHIKDGFA